LFAPWASPVNASLAWAITYLLVWLGVMGLLYRRRIFIRV
jgi:predicted acyltransferase